MKLTTAQLNKLLFTLEDLGLYSEADKFYNNVKNGFDYSEIETNINNLVESSRAQRNLRLANKIELAMIREVQSANLFKKLIKEINPNAKKLSDLNDVEKAQYEAGKLLLPASPRGAGGRFIAPPITTTRETPQLSRSQNVDTPQVTFKEPGNLGGTDITTTNAPKNQNIIDGIFPDTQPGPAYKVWKDPNLYLNLIGLGAVAGGIYMYLNKNTGEVTNQNGKKIPYNSLPPEMQRKVEEYKNRQPGNTQMIKERLDSGQITTQEAIRANRFIYNEKSNKNLKTERNWYDHALNKSNGDKDFANNVISIIKAQPHLIA